jgi:hypothetical protein
MAKKAKFSLYVLVLGAALLLGGIAHQIIVGVSLMNMTDPAVEQFGFMLMSRGSIALIGAYALTFIGGLLVWWWGPFSFKTDYWFLVAFLLFYIWFPVDIYTIILDLQFTIQFDLNQPLTDELRALFFSRQMSLGPIPLMMLVGYLSAIGLAIFQPRLRRHHR